MAYMSQEKKATIAPKVKDICKKYGVKASLSVQNHSSLVLTIKSGKIDFIKNYLDVQASKNYNHSPCPKPDNMQVNPYCYKEQFSGEALEFMLEIFTVMNSGNHDNSDLMTDYFDVGWYVDVNIGKWDSPYIHQG